MRTIFLAVLVTLLSGGCAGWGQNVQCRRSTWGDCWECVDDAGLFSQRCSSHYRGETREHRREMDDLQRIVDDSEWRIGQEDRIRRDGYRQQGEACRAGRYGELSPRDAELCRLGQARMRHLRQQEH